MTFKKNKRGFELAFGAIFGIISVLLAGGILIFVLKGQTEKLNEGLEIGLCKISNEIRFGLNEKIGITTKQHLCKTIDKSKKRDQIPNKKYSKYSEGSATEVRDMIGSCWNMWLDGSVGNMFEEYPSVKGCFTCYTFKIKDKSSEFDFESLSIKMSDPFFARDTSDKCTQSGSGGFWKTKEECKQENGIQVGETKNNNVCCLARNNHCKNKGGVCLRDGSSPSGRSKYDKWACSKTRDSCYVKDVNLFSYTDYIRRFGARGGEIIFVPPPGSQSNNINYVSNEIYAISFVSPNGGWCWEEGGCLASIGDKGYITLGTALATTTAVAGTFIAIIKAPFIITALLSAKALEIVADNPLKTGAALGGAIYFAEDLGKGFLNLLTSALKVEMPNFLIVSTKAHAEQIGCVINPGQ